MIAGGGGGIGAVNIESKTDIDGVKALAPAVFLARNLTDNRAKASKFNLNRIWYIGEELLSNHKTFN
ncbi:MAG: hypothetical protein JGK21_29315 [Microcoleus sp. PH2017_22_RUC_O_B]|uniref:hypothetical protein n=2 Tax=unclassified Microcoleus TaxID=2642155 RepID=UPI001D95124A|nr:MULTISPECIES: hypothetical protein [unclassified Microcoleus]MCC3532085.1 hypothetical protein [Microcoleus sp. PH2017_21_RUC_O_A]MCC3544356.1 hypothetical protein [Microcoleus sp. PH2017_22_RUC_O_B]